ncbi:MAG: beta-ketoacyl synthase chain length factor [Deltaproteobacteria bacterium]|nr:beta-ketoacyl synthase chain length factor [Deltaproteobacteria bacterium]
MEIYINGIGVVGGFGAGTKDLITCLDNGSSPVKASDKGLGYTFPADTSRLEDFVQKRALRRIDRFSQLAILGAYLALQDAGMPLLAGKRTGLIVCSGYGASQTTFSFLDSLINDGDACASPTLFSNSVHNSAAGHITILLKLGGPCLTVSQFEMSVPSALMSACQWLSEGRVDQVLFGAVDEYCDVLGYCWKRFFGEAADGTMRPLSHGLQSAVPGEGSAFFLLSRDKTDHSRYGYVADVRTGRMKDREIDVSEDALYILGADGHKGCDALYGHFIPWGIHAACYSPIYGSLPIGTAFDMAVAALCIREKRIFSSPESVADQGRYKIVRQASPMTGGSIICLKLAKDHEFGMITLMPI